MEAIITPIVECLIAPVIAPVKRHLGFLIFSNVDDMNAKFAQLKAIADDMKSKEAGCKENSQVVPHLVPDWLIQYEKINEEVGRIPTGGDGCFNTIKNRYKAGKTSSHIIKRIYDLKNQESTIDWTNLQQVPLYKVHDDGDGTENVFTSRKLIYKNLLEALDPSNKTQKMAICGMGGIGKTTMMEDLKKAVDRKHMFDGVVRVVIGKKTDTAAFQQAVAEFIALPLSEKAEVARKDRLRKKFSEMSKNGTSKILIILDDVWEPVDLKVIGLSSPLPNGFKLMLTSRDEQVCSKMDVETSMIFRMVGLKEEEAKLLFWEIAGANDEFNNLGEDILKRCVGLPMAIKTIASSLRGAIKDSWEAALLRLKRHVDLEDLDGIMQHIFELSYDHLKNDDKAIFVLSGLFPDDFDIPVEELMRYGWGLKLFDRVCSLAEARKRTKASVHNLKCANLLTESYLTGCVKMHDLARAFVLKNILEFKQVSIVNHGDNSEWPTEDTRDCCERMLLNCSGMSKFAQDFNYPNLVLLNLMMNYKERLAFPEDFYDRMGKFKVISYRTLYDPLLPVQRQCSETLRTLCLRSCSLPVDISFLGDLSNLEVLSFAYCGVKKLPSTIGKLIKLKLLDLTGCIDLCIDAGVFQKLDKLEELYLRSEYKAIRFTEDSCDGLEILSKKLFALDVEFFKNILKPKIVSFTKLERFQISMGCPLETKPQFASDFYSYKNTLKLATNTKELLECEVNKLFVNTEELELSVKDLNHLEEILQPPSHHSFGNLEVLTVSNCADLTSLFTIPVANGMKKLERLQIRSCPVLKSLIGNKNSGVREISFPKLKRLTLHNLPNLVSLCETAIDVMGLPQLTELVLDDVPNFTSIFPCNNNDVSSTQVLLRKKVMIPKLETLRISKMERLKEIWSCSSERDDEEVNYDISMLRKIVMKECNGVVNLFPRNPIRLLSHLEVLQVRYCGSIEVLFNIDMGKTQQLSSKSNLRRIEVFRLKMLREMWRIKDAENNSPPHLLISGFQAVESIRIWRCEKFRNVFTPTTAHFDMGALMKNDILDCGEGSERNNNAELDEIINNSQEQEINTKSTTHVAFPFPHTFHHLREIEFVSFKGVEVVFEIESSPSVNRGELQVTTTTQQPFLLLPSLEELNLRYMDTLTHVWKWKWKCNWNEFLMKHQPQSSSSSSFQNLTTITLVSCISIKYLFSPLMAKLLSNLSTIKISFCHGMEEVVSNTDDDAHEDLEMNTATLFPRLDLIELFCMSNLKHIGGGVGAGAAAKGSTSVIYDNDKFSQVGIVSWSLCQYSRHIYIHGCPSIVEIFETREINNSGCSSSTNLDQGSTGTTHSIPRREYITMHKLSNLKTLEIIDCAQLEYVFTFSTLESLRQLEQLTIASCNAMKVIVREENGGQTRASEIMVFPRLTSIKLHNLPNLAGFFVGKNDFEWPLLDFVEVNDCPQMKMFTSGESTTPKLKYINTSLGKHDLKGGLKFHFTPTLQQDDNDSYSNDEEENDEEEETPKKIIQKLKESFEGKEEE